MEKTFEYLETKVFIEKLNLKDIGNTIIEGIDHKGIKYYLTIQTDLGFTRICEFGPISDFLLDQKSFSFRFYKIEYKEVTLASVIEKFLQNTKYEIEKASEISFDELYKYNEINLIDFIKGLGR